MPPARLSTWLCCWQGQARELDLNSFCLDSNQRSKETRTWHILEPLQRVQRRVCAWFTGNTARMELCCGSSTGATQGTSTNSERTDGALRTCHELTLDNSGHPVDMSHCHCGSFCHSCMLLWRDGRDQSAPQTSVNDELRKQGGVTLGLVVQWDLTAHLRQLWLF